MHAATGLLAIVLLLVIINCFSTTSTQTLHIGDHGRIERVTQAMWDYEVSGKRVLTQWFSYRKKNRDRPMIGDRRPPSKLSDIQPAGWPAEYTTELLNVLNVLGRLTGLEPRQADLLDRICASTLIDGSTVEAVVAATPNPSPPDAESLFNT